MKKIILTIVLATLCLFFRVNAQSQTKTINIKPLNIGDTIPEAVWNMPLQVVNHPEGKKTITLNDYRGKLIILDFWATWCGSCLKAFPKIDSLQRRFNMKMQILGVAYEAYTKINAFFLAKIGEQFHFPSITDDSTLSKFFPHHLIPHYVWIGVDGRIRAITAGDNLSAENLHKILNENSDVSFQFKKDLSYDTPLFLSDDYPKGNELMHYSILSKGGYDGLPMGSRFRRTGKVVYGRALTNTTILTMYEAAIYALFEQNGDHYNKWRLIMNVADASKIHWTLPKNDSTEYYNYELVVPIKNADSLYQYMLKDLNRFTGYWGRIEKRRVSCYSLTRTTTSRPFKTTGNKQENTLFNKQSAKLINSPISYLVNRLYELSYIDLPIVDRTGIKENIDLKFKNKPKSIQDLNTGLRATDSNYNLPT